MLGSLQNDSSIRNQLSSPACTYTSENICRVIPTLKQWRNAAMALRWTAAAMLEVAKGFRRLKADLQLPILTAALAAHAARHTGRSLLDREVAAA
jgi:hypothetical protein